MNRFLSSKKRQRQAIYAEIIAWIQSKGYRHGIVETAAGNRALVYLRESGIVVLVFWEKRFGMEHAIAMYGTFFERLEEIVDREAFTLELQDELDAKVMSMAELERELSEDAKVGEGYYTTCFSVPWSASPAEAFKAQMDELDEEFDSEMADLKRDDYDDDDDVRRCYAERATLQARKDSLRRSRFFSQCAKWIDSEGYGNYTPDDSMAIGFEWHNEERVELRIGNKGQIMLHAYVYLPMPAYDQSAMQRQREKVLQLKLRSDMCLNMKLVEDFISVQVHGVLNLDAGLPFHEAISKAFVPVFKTFQSLHECIDPELLKTRSRIQEYLFASVQAQTECNMNEVYCIDKMDHVLNLKIVSPTQIEINSDLWVGECAERLLQELRELFPYLNVSADEDCLLIDGTLIFPSFDLLEETLQQKLVPLLQWRMQINLPDQN